jgi:hypothetical protein
VTLASSGLASLGVNRLLKSTDELKDDVKQHGERLAAMEVKMPNGEWRAIKDGVADLHTEVIEVRHELSRHILDETKQFDEMSDVVGTCRVLLKKQRAIKRVRR